MKMSSEQKAVPNHSPRHAYIPSCQKPPIIYKINTIRTDIRATGVWLEIIFKMKAENVLTIKEEQITTVNRIGIE